MCMESYNKVKNGCKKHNDCFSCPFDDCQIDQSYSNRIEKAGDRRNIFKELFRKGCDPQKASEIVGVSLTTAYRARRFIGNI